MIAASEASAELAADVHAVDVRQPEVEEHDVAGRAAQRVGAHANAVGGIAGPL